MAVVFSGIQSTGSPHLGNYLGAIVNWLSLQNHHHCWFAVMNLHSITTPQNPQHLKQNTLLTVATYLACGLDVAKSTIFVQSAVSQHSELAWILNTITPIGWLKRMTQFKDKSQKLKDENINLGLFAYPILMASDILLYNTNLVPVGEDQKQHLELTCHIASAFNRHFSTNIFTLPQPLILQQNKRVMSLQDASKKMSKSDTSDLSKINLNDTPEQILHKIKKAKTDSNGVFIYNQEQQPELYNLINIFASFSQKNSPEIINTYQNSGYGKFKNDLAELIISCLTPIWKKTQQLLNDQAYLEEVILQGNQKAQQQASQKLAEVFNLLGL
jgi:tryptophanyl-tRNA synthetase